MLRTAVRALVISAGVGVLVFAIARVALAVTAPGIIPVNGDAVYFTCDEPEFGVDTDDMLPCDDAGGLVFDMDHGPSTNARLVYRWRGDPASGWWLELNTDRGASNNYGDGTGSPDDYLLCATLTSHTWTSWASNFVPYAVAGGYDNWSHNAGARNLEDTGTIEGYAFFIGEYTYDDPQADCAAADPGAPQTGIDGPPTNAPALVNITVSTDNVNDPHQVGIAVATAEGYECDEGTSVECGLMVEWQVCEDAQPSVDCDGVWRSSGFAVSQVSPNYWRSADFHHFRDYQTFSSWSGITDPYDTIDTTKIRVRGMNQLDCNVDKIFINGECFDVDYQEPHNVPDGMPPDWPDEHYVDTNPPPADDGPTIGIQSGGQPDEVTTFILDNVAVDGDVECYIQGATGAGENPWELTTTDGDVTWTYTFAEAGAYNVWCDSAEDPIEFEQVRYVASIGAGLYETLEDLLALEGCGSWVNISCHIQRAVAELFVPDDFQESMTSLHETAEGAFPFSLVVDIYDAFSVLSADLPASSRPSISIPLDPLGNGGGDFTLTAPDLSSEANTNASEVCDWDGTETDSCGTYAQINDDGGVFELFGFRTVIRLTLEIGLYFSFLWWAIRMVQSRTGTGGDA